MPEATELTFKLRPGLMYSDGTPLNAKRFEYSISATSTPTTAGEYACHHRRDPGRSRMAWC